VSVPLAFASMHWQYSISYCDGLNVGGTEGGVEGACVGTTDGTWLGDGLGIKEGLSDGRGVVGS